MTRTGHEPGEPGLDREACYRALRTRDPRFDGRFYTAVLSTGVFCRPVCPARAPRAEHCVFYRSAAAAHASGFRPCLRCRPELAPGVAGWRGTANTVSRALALIADGVWREDEDVEVLAERLGVGGRHLRRLFARHVGAPPIAVAQAQRVLFARRLLAETGMPMADVALAAGFGSVRRFNDAMRRTFGRAPRELRGTPAAAPADGGIALRLAHTTPYHWPAMLSFLADRAIPGVEEVQGEEYRRSFAFDGVLGSVAVRPLHRTSQLLAIIRVSRIAALPVAVGRIRRLFDLDADAGAIDAHLVRDPVLAPLVRARPGLRVPGGWDEFELAVRAILGQQVSVAAARTIAGRIAAAQGQPVPFARPGLAFPGPERLAEAPLERLGLPRARAAAVGALAKGVLEDPSLLRPAVDLDSTVERLAALPGIGRWTAQYVAMRAFREPDAFPAADLGLRRAMAREGLRPTPAELAQRAEAWRPWRAYAAVHLWNGGALWPAEPGRGVSR